MIGRTQLSPRPPRRRTTMIAALVVTACALTGCATRDDPRFNRYRAPDTAATLMQRADRVMDAAGQLLDNLDARMENAIR